MIDGTDAHQVAPGLVMARRDGPAGVRLAVAGEIDAGSASAFLAQLHVAVMHGDGSILVDLSAVTFMDSSGITALLQARESAGRRLRLGPLHPSVRRVLEITDVLELFVVGDAVSSPADPPATP